jgi:Putative inner membrane protein (DUF1819)
VFLSDVQTFLDTSLDEHPEILHWSFETRLRQARAILAILHDYGLLKGDVNKSIALPAIPDKVIYHLIRLLKAEGIPQEQIAYHPDWQLWL